jgi:hypothetical protein
VYSNWVVGNKLKSESVRYAKSQETHLGNTCTSPEYTFTRTLLCMLVHIELVSALSRGQNGVAMGQM